MKKYVVYVVVLIVLCVAAGLIAGLTIGKNAEYRDLPEIQERRDAPRGGRHEKKMGEKRLYGEKGKHSLKKLVKKLDLNEKQEEEVKEILEDTRKEIGLVGKAFREKIKEIKAAGQNKILAILTPEQQEKFKEMVEKRREKRLYKKRQRPSLQ